MSSLAHRLCVGMSRYLHACSRPLFVFHFAAHHWFRFEQAQSRLPGVSTPSLGPIPSTAAFKGQEPLSTSAVKPHPFIRGWDEWAKAAPTQLLSRFSRFSSCPHALPFHILSCASWDTEWGCCQQWACLLMLQALLPSSG